MEAEIEKILNQHIRIQTDWLDGGHKALRSIVGKPEAAAAIAEAWQIRHRELEEQDNTAYKLFHGYSKEGGLTPSETLHQVSAHIDELSQALAEVLDDKSRLEAEFAAKEAQVAEMAVLLNGFVQAYERYPPNVPLADIDIDSIWRRSQKALAAAPKKVLWEGEGAIEHTIMALYGKLTRLRIADGVGSDKLLILSKGYQWEDGQFVTVIVKKGAKDEESAEV